MNQIHSFNATLNDGTDKPLADYQDKVLLIVNTASKCGFTPQYKGLQTIYDKYSARGLEILAFPCDQFGHQEPGGDAEIAEFCSLNYDVTFPLFKKVEVNGDNAAPVYQFLKSEAPGIFGSESIKWNFTKFLVAKDGKVLRRYSPKTKPEQLANDIEKALG